MTDEPDEPDDLDDWDDEQLGQATRNLHARWDACKHNPNMSEARTLRLTLAIMDNDQTGYDPTRFTDLDPEAACPTCIKMDRYSATQLLAYLIETFLPNAREDWLYPRITELLDNPNAPRTHPQTPP